MIASSSLVVQIMVAVAALSSPASKVDTVDPTLNPATTGTVIQLSAEDADRSIRMRLRDHASIQLKANPSTGYRWEVISAHNIRVDEPISVVNPSAAPQPRVGEPGIAIIKARPLRAGTGALILAYKQPWERSITRKVRYKFLVSR